MKIYTVDLGWEGGFTIVAETREEAWALLPEWYTKCPKRVRTPGNLTEHEITKSLVIDFHGDC